MAQATVINLCCDIKMHLLILIIQMSHVKPKLFVRETLEMVR